MTTVKYDITLMVPLLHFTSNITLTAATELVFGHEEQADRDSCISNEKKQLILMGNLAGHEKSAIDSYYWRHYIENNIGLTCPYF